MKNTNRASQPENYNPETDPDNYEYVNYQGFPGQIYQRKVANKNLNSLLDNKTFPIVAGILFWGIIVIIIVLAIL